LLQYQKRLYLPRPALFLISGGFVESDRKELTMTESVYKVIELVGTSSESWEKAATAAVEKAAKSLKDLRVAEVIELDMQLEDGKVLNYRAKVKVSFKYREED
jgi:flavin-binding protein dodecin